MPSQFAYLQLYSRHAGFGGLPEVETLVKRLWEISDDEGKAVAAALTDTFSLAAYPELRQRLADNGLRPLAATEIVLTIADVPYALLLYATSETGYGNLCRIITNGMHKVEEKPLLASVDINTLNLFSEDLIAVSPYFGGPVTSATKSTDAKRRARLLHGIFGVENFYLGVPGILPTVVTENDKISKQNEALLKLSQDLKIGLVATGEARYLRPTDSRAYQSLRNRLQRALSEQLPHAVIQQRQLNKHDWFYSFNRPNLDLHVRPPAELVKFYAESVWPNVLLNNIKIAQRAAVWNFAPNDSLEWLRRKCLEKLAESYQESEQEATRLRMETELADIQELNLADSLRAAITLRESAENREVVAIPRYLSGSIIANLSGLSQQKVNPSSDAPFSFEIYAGRQVIRLETGADGRALLLESTDRERTCGAPALASGESDLLPTIHPRYLITSFETSLENLLPLQPGHGQNGIEYGLQTGEYLPPGCAKVEVSETSGVTRLQLALDAVNECQNYGRDSELLLKDLPEQLEAEFSSEDTSFERGLTLTRLNWLKNYHAAAFYAAALTIAAGNKEQTAKVAELARLSGIKILPPDIRKGRLNYSLENPETIRVGLIGLLNRETVNRLKSHALNPGPFATLTEFLEKAAFQADELERLAWAGALDGFGKREDLVASLPELVKTAQAWQDWQERKKAAENNPGKIVPPKATPAGQLDLFALLPETPEEVKFGHDKPILPVLAEGVAVSRLERLRKAYAALGFFTVEHPLLTLPTTDVSDVSRHDAVPLGRVSETATPSGTLIVIGLVTGIRRVPLALAGEGQGEELTILQLEDFTGKAELLVAKDTPSEGITPEEGAVIAAQTRRLAANERLVLVALALAPYPPLEGRPIFPAAPDAAEPDDLLPLEDVPAFEDAPPPEGTPNENEWEASLFATLGATEAAKPQPETLPPGQPIAPSKGGSKTKGKPAPVRIKRTVHLTIAFEPDEEKESRILDGLKRTLLKFAGEDTVILYLEQEDGSYRKLEPQGIGVAHSQDFEAAVMHWIGMDGIKVEERAF